MSTITTRAGKGSPLTNTEVDSNFTNLNTDKYESGDNVSFGTGTFSGALSSTRLTVNTPSGTGRYINFVDNATTATKYNWIFGTQQTQDDGFEITPSTTVGGSTYSYPSISGTTGATVVNEGSQDRDFRVESDTNTHALFVDAGVSKVGVGTGTPAATLHVAGAHTADRGTVAFFGSSNASNSGLNGGIGIVSDPTNLVGGLDSLGTNSVMRFRTNVGGNAIERLGLYNGESVLNDDGAAQNLRVESSGNANMLFVDGTNNRVAIGHSSPILPLHVNGGMYASTYQSDTSRYYPVNFNSGGGIAYLGKLRVGSSTDGYAHIVVNSSHDHGQAIPGRMEVTVKQRSGTLSGYAIYYGDAQSGNDSRIKVATVDSGATMEVWLVSDDYLNAVVSVDLRGGSDWQYGQTGGNATGKTILWDSDDHIVARFTDNATVINESSRDADFRVESDSNYAALFVDSGNSRAGVNTSTPATYLDVFGDATSATVGTSSVLRLSRAQTDAVSFQQQADFKLGRHTAPGGTYQAYTRLDIDLRDDSTDNTAEKNVLTLTNHPRVGINMTSPAYPLHVFTGADYATFATNDGVGSAGGFGIQFRVETPYQDVVARYSGVYTSSNGGNGAYGGSKIDSVKAGVFVESVRYAHDQSIFNDGSADLDLRVESDSNAYMLFVEGSTNRVGIGTSTPTSTLTVGAAGTQTMSLGIRASGGNANGRTLLLEGVATSAGEGSGRIFFTEHNSTDASADKYGFSIHYDGEGPTTTFPSGFAPGTTNAQWQFRGHDNSVNGLPIITGARNSQGFVVHGGITVNDDSLDYDFRVESDGNSNMLFVDAGNNRVGIGTGTPNVGSMHVVGNTADAGTNTYYAAKFSAGSYSDAGSYTTMIGLGVESAASWSKGAIGFTRYSSYDVGYIGFYVNGDSSGASTTTLSHERLRITPSDIVVNDTSSDVDFRVESDAKSHALFVDAGNNLVMVGRDTATETTGVYGCIINATGSTSNIRTFGDGTTHYHYQFIHNTLGGVGSIVTTTSGTTFNTTSDRRLKENIEPLTDGTAKVMAMNPVTHTWIADKDAPAVHGFIAQEMREIVPEAVSGTPDGEEMMSMDYGRITPVLVAALQDAHRKIAELESRLAAMEAK